MCSRLLYMPSNTVLKSLSQRNPSHVGRMGWNWCMHNSLKRVVTALYKKGMAVQKEECRKTNIHKTTTLRSLFALFKDEYCTNGTPMPGKSYRRKWSGLSSNGSRSATAFWIATSRALFPCRRFGDVVTILNDLHQLVDASGIKAIAAPRTDVTNASNF